MGYTLKQWGLRPEELDPSVTGRVPIVVSRDDRYFQDQYQAMPKHGYTEMFRKMLSHPNIQVLLKVDYRDVREDIRFGRMIYTGSLDEFFGDTHGILPYRSLRFESVTLEVEFYQEVATVNYPDGYDFTRITEQKHLSGQQLPVTTLVYEYPEAYRRGKNEPYYPIPREETRELHRRYSMEAEKMAGVALFAGRLADYKYYNMDQAVARALKLFKESLARK